MEFNTIPIFVAVMLKRGNEILLLKRSSTRTYAPNKYHLMGGHVEQGETFCTAAIREAREELGIVIQSQDLKFVHMYHRTSIEPTIVVTVFECVIWQGEIANIEPEKHSDVAWFNVNNLPDDMVIPHKNAIELITQGIAYSEQ